MEFISVRNFEKLQHYKHRNPPWIKLYRDLLDDNRFFELTDEERYHLIGLFILASQNDNKIPNKPEWIKYQLRSNQPISLQRLIDTGWIEVVVQDASKVLARCKQGASKVLARCKQNALSEKSRVEKRKEEIAITWPVSTSIAGKPEYSWDDDAPEIPPEPVPRPENPLASPKYSDLFELFWKHSTRRGSKPDAARQFEKLNLDPTTAQPLFDGMQAWMKSDQWQDQTLQPHVHRWLRRRGWEESVPVPRVEDRPANAAPLPTTSRRYNGFV